MSSPSDRQSFFALCAMVYVALVLIVDSLAALRVDWWIEWRDVHRYFATPWGSVDGFKLWFWLFIPLVFCLPRMDWAWLGAGRMHKSDWWILTSIALAGAAAMMLIPLVPELQKLYPRLSMLPADVRWAQFQEHLAWILSWIIGWEFLHRYLLLRSAKRLWPVGGWFLVPLSEGLYHLQKPLLEAFGMVGLSVVLTLWTLRRRTLLPALLAHFVIELELMAYQYL